MSDPCLRRKVVVRNPQGLHLRPADAVAKTASQFQSRIEIEKDGERVDGKSILALLTLAAVQGSELWIEAEGADAPAALEAVAELLGRVFAEDDPAP